MLPVCILCHAACDPADYFCEYLETRQVPYHKMNVLNTSIVDLDLEAVSGLVLMGGPYSLLDDCDWMAVEIEVIQRALKKNLPVMGVCLGAQLISKALGARVSVAEHTEIGWHSVRLGDAAKAVLADSNLPLSFDVFEWHEDSFSIPQGATPIFKGDHFDNQGYVMGNILAMQFHLEMTPEMIYEWLHRYKDCLPAPSAYVQSPDQVTENLDQRLKQLHAVADALYGWWLGHVSRGINWD